MKPGPLLPNSKNTNLFPANSRAQDPDRPAEAVLPEDVLSELPPQKEAYKRPPGSLLEFPAPVGYHTDVVELEKFRTLFADSLPREISPVAIIDLHGATHGVVFCYSNTTYIALGQHFEVRRVTKPASTAAVLAILKEKTLSQALSFNPSSGPWELGCPFSSLIELSEDEGAEAFWDADRLTYVKVRNIHEWAIAYDSHWHKQFCECQFCVSKRESGAGRTMTVTESDSIDSR